MNQSVDHMQQCTEAVRQWLGNPNKTELLLVATKNIAEQVPHETPAIQIGDTQTLDQLLDGLVPEPQCVDNLDHLLQAAKDHSCSCKHQNGQPCYTYFTPEELATSRMTMAFLQFREQNMLLLGIISAGINMSPMTARSKKKSQTQRRRARTRYFYQGKQLCVTTFGFLYNVCYDRNQRFSAHYQQNGLCPVESQKRGAHGHKKALSFEDISRVVNFLKTYAEDHALVLPGRVPGLWRDDVVLLPSSHTKTFVYGKSSHGWKIELLLTLEAASTACTSLPPNDGSVLGMPAKHATDLSKWESVGGRKNNFVLYYLAWRVAMCLHKTISLHFMVAGHTKFAPDWCFGLLKQAFRRSKVDSLECMESVVNGSAACNIAQLIGWEDGRVVVPVYDWNAHLSPHGQHMKGIKENHHFKVSRPSTRRSRCLEDKVIGTDTNRDKQGSYWDTRDEKRFCKHLCPKGSSK
ncbi:hypothetical protein CAPTEDRAFT_188926 [Capitella teleta]|uniref:DUF7869 domain-containing protein n=1 Tax=Capitella teleta TaxID=283909 RepID=R7UAH5_CAPTE|nr:hypothetical protein CAPTEDRAFT_188926 [Capitella teleta]|eukprot:ELU00818.1 hypothetical protein CAPTEDRAFT_188926 [Capitella teleta]